MISICKTTNGHLLSKTHTKQRQTLLYEIIEKTVTYFPDVVKICDFWRQSTMYTQELLVHKCSQGKAVEGVHTCVIHPL